MVTSMGSVMDGFVVVVTLAILMSDICGPLVVKQYCYRNATDGEIRKVSEVYHAIPPPPRLLPDSESVPYDDHTYCEECTIMAQLQGKMDGLVWYFTDPYSQARLMKDFYRDVFAHHVLGTEPVFVQCPA